MRQPYQSYGGQRVAGLSGLEAASHQGLGALAQQGLPGQFQQGSQAGQAALGQMSRAGGMGYNDMSGIARGYNPMMSGAMGMGQGYANQFGSMAQGAMNTQNWPDANIQGYMNPYQQNVTDIAAREAQKMGQSQLQNLGSQAATSGAFGGSRHALLEGDVMQGTRQNIADITQSGQRDAYQSAMGQFNADRSAQLQGRGMAGNLLGQGLGAAQYGFDAGFRGLDAQGQNMFQGNQLYQQGAQGMMGGAMNMAAMGQMGQGMNFDMLNMMNQYGGQHRHLQQAGLDMGYQDYLRQERMPEQRMGFMSGILGGFPTSGQTDYYSHQQPTSLANSLLGVGLGGAAMNRNTQPQGGGYR